MNNDTLLYWHKLENFYPYILEEQHNEKIKSFKIARECEFRKIIVYGIMKCIWEFLG